MSGIAIGCIVMFCGVFFSSQRIIGIGTALLGITILLLPMVTPETIAIFGYRKSKIIARAAGVLLLLISVWIFYE